MRHRGNENRTYTKDSEISQKKSLGQVFLNTDWPVIKIVDLLKSSGVTRVLEIGPGNGILTEALSNAQISVTAVEKDDRFSERLNDLIRSGHLPHVRVVNQDVLKFDLQSWIAEGHGTPSAVVGNIPYNISTPIVMWVLPYLDKLRSVTFMTQLEFALRLVAVPESKDYGSLSVYCQLRSDCELNFKVERSCFSPVPKVDSAVMTLRSRMEAAGTAAQLRYAETICRVAFTQRRKKLRNAVKPFLGSREEVGCPIDLNRRAETLTPEDFIELATFLFPDKI